MKILYFRHPKEGEFVVLSDDSFVTENTKEFSSDGYVLKFVGDVISEQGSESGLPTDRELTP